ncbi:MAG: hypothetical protein SFY66_19600 [Oculatellaceae cyanobacterium bins.114]|nr:hypothetical protein [Oculatellaceae cyanobacterium bins.114]
MDLSDEQQRLLFARLARHLMEGLGETRDEFAARFDMTTQNLWYWIGSKNNPIARTSPSKIAPKHLTTLASLAGWSIEQLWFYLKTGNEPSNDSVANLKLLMQSAPLTDVEAAIAIGVRRLAQAAGVPAIERPVDVALNTQDVKYKKTYISRNSQEGVTMSVGSMIAGGLQKSGDKFIVASGLSESRLKTLANNPSLASNEELEAIAKALYSTKVTKELWTVAELHDLIRTTRRPTGQT